MNKAIRLLSGGWLSDALSVLTRGWFTGISGEVTPPTSAIAQFDNVIIWTRQQAFDGTIDDVSNTDRMEFPGDTILQALSYYTDILDWEWRTTAQAGAGNDEIEIGETIGDDVSDTIVFEEGKNLEGLSLSPSGQQLCTLLHFWGQGQDSNQRLASSRDFDAWDTYGVIEDGFSDNRISTNDLARQKCDNELVKRKDGTASMSATIIDNPQTIGQWREGDTVQVKAKRPDIDQAARIIEVEYTSGSLSRRVVFDKFPRSRSGTIGRLMDDVGKIDRGTKGNAGNVILHYKPNPRWVDDFDPRIRYINRDDTYKWQSWTGGLAEGAYGATLHGTSSNSNYLEFDFEGTGIAVYCRKAPNLVDINSGKYMRIFIDGVLQANVGLKSTTTDDQQLVWSTNSLSSGAHTIKLQRGGGTNYDIYIDLDAFKLTGWLWQFYLEGRAVNTAELSFNSSNDSASISIIIDGTDRTTALGGPWYGDQHNIDVHQFISAPGLHTVEFINNSSAYETFLEASLVCKVLV